MDQRHSVPRSNAARKNDYLTEWKQTRSVSQPSPSTSSDKTTARKSVGPTPSTSNDKTIVRKSAGPRNRFAPQYQSAARKSCMNELDSDIEFGHTGFYSSDGGSSRAASTVSIPRAPSQSDHASTPPISHRTKRVSRKVASLAATQRREEKMRAGVIQPSTSRKNVRSARMTTSDSRRVEKPATSIQRKPARRITIRSSDSDSDISIRSASHAKQPKHAARKRYKVTGSDGSTIDISDDGDDRSAIRVDEDSDSNSDDYISIPSDSDSSSSISSVCVMSELARRFPLLIKRSESMDPPPSLLPPPSSSPTSRPSDALLSALLQLITPSLRFPFKLKESRFRLPFTKKSLMKGFISKCTEKKGPGFVLPDTHGTQQQKIPVMYRLAGTDDVWHDEIVQWRCRLCRFHLRFRSRNVFAQHLEWDHSTVGVSWKEDQKGWHLELTIPSIEATMRAESPPHYSRDIVKVEEQPLHILFPPPASKVASIPSNVLRVHCPAPKPEQAADVADLRLGEHQRLPAEQKVIPKTPSSPTPDPESILNPALENMHITDPPDSRSLSEKEGQEEEEEPEPEPLRPRSIFGPTAQYPYLPAKARSDGASDVPYSCRPGGPKIYDLLGTLPLEPYGILECEVIDREEEIFATDDSIQDEHKVIHALWARWIFFNRARFIGSPFERTLDFINENYEIIHEAAGWDALRHWLLILVVKRFLTGEDLVLVVLQYEKLVGIEPYNPEQDSETEC